MADVYVNALTTISTEPSTTDSIVVVNRNTNEGQIIDYELLASKILEKLTSQTFSSLNTTSKLITGAINELDADTQESAIQQTSLKKGTAIAENDNLNSYTTPGRYYSASGTITTSLSNIPSDVTTGFILIVEEGTAANYIRQKIYPNVNLLRYYERLNSGGTWGEWYQFVGSTNKPFIMKTYSYQYTLAAGASGGLTTSNFGITGMDGYAGLILRYWITGSENVVAYSANETSNTSGNNQIVLRVKNISSSSVTATASITMLFVSSNLYVTD